MLQNACTIVSESGFVVNKFLIEGVEAFFVPGTELAQ
jgi:hypothetical protein